MVISIAIVLSKVVSVALFGNNQSSDSKISNVDKVLQNAAKEMATQLPINMNSSVHLVGVSYDNGLLKLRYKLFDHDVSIVNNSAFKDKTLPIQVDKFCNDQSTEILRSRPDGRVQHSYYGKDGSLVAKILVTKDKCK